MAFLHTCMFFQPTSCSFDSVAKSVKHGLGKWIMKWAENRLVCQTQRVPMIQNPGSSWLSAVPLRGRSRLQHCSTPSLKMGTMGHTKLLESLQTLKDQSICSSVTMVFRATSVGWRKRLKETSWSSKNEMQNPVSGTNQSQEPICWKAALQKKNKLFLKVCSKSRNKAFRSCNKQKSNCKKEKKWFTTRVVKHQKNISRGIVLSPALEIFKALNSLISLTLLWPGRWTRGLQSSFPTQTILWLFF